MGEIYHMLFNSYNVKGKWKNVFGVNVRLKGGMKWINEREKCDSLDW